jgi:hypothetical protein
MGRDAGHGLDRRRMGEISLTLSWIDSAMQGYPVFFRHTFNPALLFGLDGRLVTHGNSIAPPEYSHFIGS